MGSHIRGEIEIASDPRQVQLIALARQERAERQGLAGNAGDIGVICADEYIQVIRDPVIFPNGHTGTYLRIVEGSGDGHTVGVAVLPVRGNNVFLRRIFRHALRRWEIEIPRGFRHSEATDSEAARAELREELGLPINRLVRMGEVVPNSGLLSSVVAVYCAFVGEGECVSTPEASEAFGEVLQFGPLEIASATRDGLLRDAFTLSALHLASVHGFFPLT
jgi:ADP-ribose pyrophosphatase